METQKYWHDFLRHLDLLELQNAFERAIYDAKIEERERCAQIAESFIPSGFRGKGKAGNMIGIARDDRARVIADAIRRLP